MIHIPCIIFAGGKSSRMGEDKALLPFAGFSTITQYQHHRLSEIFTTVYVSCKDKSKFNFKANFIEDDKQIQTFAPTAGFIAAFRQLKEDNFFAISVDSPFITANEINQLLDLDSELNDATVAKTNSGMQPLCGFYHRSLQKKFENMLKNNNHKLGLLLQNSNVMLKNFENEQPFLNINYRNEYNEALKLISN